MIRSLILVPDLEGRGKTASKEMHVAPQGADMQGAQKAHPGEL